MQPAAIKMLGSRTSPHTELSRERNSDRGAGAEEISQPALGYLELLQAGDRCTAVWISQTLVTAMPLCIGRHLVAGIWQLNDIHRIVRSGIVAVEEVEEFDEWFDLPALVDFDRARDAQVRLDVRRAAEFVEAGIRPRSNLNAPAVVWVVMVMGRALST